MHKQTKISASICDQASYNIQVAIIQCTPSMGPFVCCRCTRTGENHLIYDLIFFCPFVRSNSLPEIRNIIDAEATVKSDNEVVNNLTGLNKIRYVPNF